LNAQYKMQKKPEKKSPRQRAGKSASKGGHPHMQVPHAHQVRIIGGVWKRTPLPVVATPDCRPTPDRVRETVFNWINHLNDGRWGGIDCLDLFAGSGALGLEAASRGAAAVTLVDAHTPIIEQLAALKLKLNAGQVTLIRGDALGTARNMAARGQGFDLIFLDPPYQSGCLPDALAICMQLLKPGGIVYLEASQPLPVEPDGGAAAWLAAWEVVRAAQAGMVFFHLLQRRA
jgi:16S rRNA (guanine966-N2)-methyltransferase